MSQNREKPVKTASVKRRLDNQDNAISKADFMMEADFVIVGAGSAGCALAHRLSESGKHQIIIVEAGGSDWGPFIQMPGALSLPMNMPQYDWGFRTEPEPYLGNRRLVVPRGKVLGGSSSINGMVFVRGHAGDFDHWAQSGATGWAFADVLPYFRRMETLENLRDTANPWRGYDGPLRVKKAHANNPLFQAFLRAGEQAGYSASVDLNGYQQEGVGHFDQTIHRGQRCSAARAYLRPALKKGNCRLVHGNVTKILVEGKKATGVRVQTTGARSLDVQARLGAIICASSINSPKLLMLSGIGKGSELIRNGVQPIHELPGVGQNLQDHLEVYLQHSCKTSDSLNRHWNPLSKAFIGLQWLLTRTGLGASNQFEAGGFIRSRAGVAYPDVQIHFLPIAVRYDGTGGSDQTGFQVHTGPMRAQSRGSVSLNGPHWQDAPEIRFNYMDNPTDWQDFRTAIRLVRQILSQPAFDDFSGGELSPGARFTSDQALNQFIERHAESAFHPCGTCKMGSSHDESAVVDSQLRVRGMEQLYIVDSSVFPTITNGNLNAPTIMVAEKAADHILGKPALEPEYPAPFTHADWQNQQR